MGERFADLQRDAGEDVPDQVLRCQADNHRGDARRNQQRLDFDGLRGRMLSSSYIPKSGERYEAMMQALPRLFSAYAVDDRVILEYDTKIYYGHLVR